MGNAVISVAGTIGSRSECRQVANLAAVLSIPFSRNCQRRGGERGSAFRHPIAAIIRWEG